MKKTDKRVKRILLRDSLIVIPTFLVMAAWLILKLVLDVDLAPGSDYEKSMWLNLLLPLFIVGVGQLAYAVVLIIDAARAKDLSIGKMLLYIILAWFGSNWGLGIVIYICRLVYFLRKREE